MNRKIKLLGVVSILTLVITACSSSPAIDEPVIVVEEAPVEKMAEESQNDTTNNEPAPDPVESAFPDWYSFELTDVNTGEVFTIRDNIGKVYLVETLATWCSNCFKQQSEVARFHELLGETDDFESLGIDIDPNEDIPLLTGYVKKNGFDWKYVVASNAMVDEISRLYGTQFLNPPSTPMLIIDRQGNPHPLGFGIKSADELLEAVIPFL